MSYIINTLEIDWNIREMKKMHNVVKRLFVEKKEGFNNEAAALYNEIRDNLGIDSLESVKVVVRYDVEGISDDEMVAARDVVFSEPAVDNVYDEVYPADGNEKIITFELLPGQFDQRADSTAQCVQMLTAGKRPVVRTAKLVALKGDISEAQIKEIEKYLINPIEAQSAEIKKPKTLNILLKKADKIKTINKFIEYNEKDTEKLYEGMSLAMSMTDFLFIQEYFIKEGRNPTITEIKVLDTYWSDHCRHTTFLTELINIEFENSPETNIIKEAYKNYQFMRSVVHSEEKPICLMDMATIAMKYLKKKGMLDDLDESEEINACSIVVKTDVEGRFEDWLVMFKNETHNHPTEIEPFGGASTCLGGAIRDPLSGRAYVYQAMRITGSGDPRIPYKETINGKLSQKMITTKAAHGYSSYGNQIGLATGKVAEIYDEGYVAKRMELGAVVAAAPKANVSRGKPMPGDKVILLGGGTGRDGCGGATGSSKSHTDESLEACGAEVQKGDPTTERKIQRLFRNPEVSKLIKRCNDFGAGGVSVAIGELADGLDIYLDNVPVKYQGLDGTELAISESQERMAVVVSNDDVEIFINYAKEENLNAVVVADVTDKNRMRMFCENELIFDVERSFIDTNGVKQTASAFITAPDYDESTLTSQFDFTDFEKHISNLKYSSQKGLVERFDSTIGAGTVLMPFGGETQSTPSEGMVAKLPVIQKDFPKSYLGETSTVTMMTHGYDPEVSRWSPFHGGAYAVIESISRIVAMGGDYKKIRLTMQEYFEKLSDDPVKWGKPAASLLGAMFVQQQLCIPAIGGKDSMSGSFMDILEPSEGRHPISLDVPPTLVSFALAAGNTYHVISNHLKSRESKLVLLKPVITDDLLPDMDSMKKIFNKVHKLIVSGKVLSCSSVKAGGLAAAVFEMAIGNNIGVELESEVNDILYDKIFGAFILEVKADQWMEKIFKDIPYSIIASTTDSPHIKIRDKVMPIQDVREKYESTLGKIFPEKSEDIPGVRELSFNKRNTVIPVIKTAKPRVFIPVFPGTNCEYDVAKKFEIAGGIPTLQVIRNLSGSEIEESTLTMAKNIRESQIVMIPGGFSAGDEPWGSGKFIAAAFRNPKVAEEVMKLLEDRYGLILGICNGFQALIKLGLLPYGKIKDINENDPTLTYNSIGRHVSRYVNTRVSSVLSPWLKNVNVGDIHMVPVSCGEGRFVANDAVMDELIQKGQIAFQYTDQCDNPTGLSGYNPTGSMMAVEGITSPDGRILGKMGHAERTGRDVAINITGNKDQKIFESGIEYFK